MATETGTTPAVRRSGMQRATAILIGVTTLLIFVQSFTAGEFVNRQGSMVGLWTDVHGLIAYPVMAVALAAAIAAFVGRGSGSRVWLFSPLLFVLLVAQWLTGHAISTLGLMGFIPVHIVLAFVVFGLAIWLSVRTTGRRRTAS